MNYFNTAEVENKIINWFLSKGQIVHCKSNGESTKLIKDAIIDIGEEYKYLTCPSSCGTNTQFLYDLIWYSENTNADKTLHSIPLILESEWSFKYADIKYDFEKLLIVKAKIKIMVFQTNISITEITEKLVEGIKTYEYYSSDEIYIFAAFDNTKKCFVVEEYKNQSRLTIAST